ncbi:hypothetical protein A3D73_02655 [Candidatus Uhrbacteria bacterium RIFCSPHIGHO2_02_FULL_60_44]|nr:MAG: hypothetical protein A3D73_02655 [Candidatus Uhrbacteria bacterium RIFCSPHIGHO2_02_FULL_60_44]
MPSFFSWLAPFKRPSPIDRYHLKVVTNPAELAEADVIPIEIRYVLAARPERFEAFRVLLERGYGIGVRIVDKTPERVLTAVDRLSRLTQENTVIPWLPKLLRDEELPVFTRDELERAEEDGVNLYEEARTVLAERFEFRKIILVDLKNQCITRQEQEFMREVNEDLYPLAIDAIVHRVVFDNAHTRTEVAQSIIKALVVVGPIAHFLEGWLRGLGKVFAASADDIVTEIAELFALRGSGFTWRQLAQRGRILVPVLVLATYGAFQVEPLIEAGYIGWAGAVFGLSAVALSLTTAVQSIGMYRQCYERLVATGKLRLAAGQSVWKMALRQDFTNPARLGLFAGALASPILAAFVFTLATGWVHNGWVLALLGSTESVVAGFTVIAASRIERWWFRRKVSRAIAALAHPSS